jgi:uncharacterized membrane protein YtjA (UPF0391 family)
MPPDPTHDPSPPGGDHQLQEFPMLGWSIIFFVVAIIAAVFGFGGLSQDLAGIAKILFFIFIVIFAVTGLMHLMGGRRRD